VTKTGATVDIEHAYHSLHRAIGVRGRLVVSFTDLLARGKLAQTDTLDANPALKIPEITRASTVDIK
jgi:hypothetical protein